MAHGTEETGKIGSILNQFPGSDAGNGHLGSRPCEQKTADVDGKDALAEITEECTGCGFCTNGAQHICRPRVSAAHRANIFLVIKQLCEKDGEADAPEQICQERCGQPAK